MRALRNFVTAKDGFEYENLPEGMVCLHITHSNLQMQMVDIRLDLHATIAEVRHKVYRHSGTKPDAMELYVMGPDGAALAMLDDDRKMLGYYGVQNGMRLHVVDKDPFSLSKGGGLEDVSLIKKYEISEADYDKRTYCSFPYVCIPLYARLTRTYWFHGSTQARRRCARTRRTSLRRIRTGSPRR